jgi:hypothetical protein
MSSATAFERGGHGPFIAACIALSAVFFLAGVGPGYRYELDGYLGASERCPEATPTAQGYDFACVERLVEHGPLYLGKEALALSLAAGLGAIGGLFAAGDPRWTRRVTTLALAFALILLGLAALGGAADGRSLLALTLAWVIGSVVVVATRLPAGRAETILLMLYLTTWAALLIWNEGEGERIVQGGFNLAG